MNKRRMFQSSIALLSALVVVGAAWANATPSIDWYVMGSGGDHAEAGSYALQGTIGQPVVGSTTGWGVQLCSGFWCWGGSAYKTYLPLVIRNA